MFKFQSVSNFDTEYNTNIFKEIVKKIEHYLIQKLFQTFQRGINHSVLFPVSAKIKYLVQRFPNTSA